MIFFAAVATLRTTGDAQRPSEAAADFPSQIAWTVDIGAPPLAPPIVAGGRAFLALRPGLLSARSLANGREIWTTKVDVHGPPVASADTVVVPTRDALQAFRAETGDTAWSVPVDPLTAPPLMTAGWLFVATAGKLTALRAADGTQVWSRGFAPVEERLAAEGTSVYVPTTDGRLAALDVATGTTLWEATVGPKLTEPLALPDRVYVGTGSRDFVCLKAPSGKEDWRAPIGAAIRGAATADTHNVYVVAMDNLVRALHRTNGARRWSADLRYRPIAGPVVMGSAVIVPGVTPELRAFDARTGALAGRLVLPNAAPMQPAFVALEGGGGMIFTVTGSPEGRWALTAAAPPLPSIPVTPITLLPGIVVPVSGS